MSIHAIETIYAGRRFRSRLEARWAVFFDEVGVSWEYEPQGYVIDGQPYLPDFLLTDCGTWVEVKGNENALDISLMTAAAQHLPEMPYRQERGPRLLILGPIPSGSRRGDWGWIGLTPWTDPEEGSGIEDHHYGFGSYMKNRRPWVLYNTSEATSFACGGPWLAPAHDTYESGVPEAYNAALSARFEHGARG
ncbi:hypothetical protein GCM10023347_33690 [Streptomyces chumphonensis]|uniref:Uncharacterized protein n=1 Tax=Streptomyces chumphonensis TaxID=1214925 RepID=A0A927EYG2_9ACTN|nr:hypothetical protein [Streptomyces chumphonensis]MBD3931961.1 hypothetical protein [Streptomyces chumphonensis]